MSMNSGADPRTAKKEAALPANAKEREARARSAKASPPPRSAMRRPRHFATMLAIFFAFLLASACSNGEPPETTEATETPPSSETTERSEPTEEATAEVTDETTGAAMESTESADAVSEAPEPDFGFTHGQSSGNLVVGGEGGMPLSGAVDVPLGGEPVWVAGVPFREGVAWVVALASGSVEDFYMEMPGGIEPLDIEPGRLAPGAPPLVESLGDPLELVVGPGSPLTHPLPVGDSLVGVAESGEVFVESEGEVAGTGVAALPDARFTRSPSGSVAFLSEPTERYAHDVLGDGVEAEAISVADVAEDGDFEVRSRIIPESGGVFEEVSAMWVEAEGEEFIAVSESADGVGTRVALYSPDGTLAAAGPFMGEPLKWRHVLAAGPFGAGGEFEVAAARTPHLESVVEFYRPNFETGTLDIVAEAPGYTSHRLDSRNLDTARAGDMDGDGRWELLVPDRSYTELAAIRRSEAGAEVAWTLPAEGEISTNIASATDEGGRASIAVGRSDGMLRVWR